MPLVAVARLVLPVIHDDPRNFKELRCLELLHNVLQLGPLDQLRQLIEALCTALYLLCLVLRHVEVAQDQGRRLLVRVLGKRLVCRPL